MTWHWVDPAAGAEQAARVLRPGGRIALFWNAFQVPPPSRRPSRRSTPTILPDHPMYRHSARSGKDIYAPLLTSTAERLAATGFEQAEQWRDEWQRTYTRAEWLDLFPTFGGHALMPRETVAALQDAIGAEVDAAGGEFAVEYATVTVTAVRGVRTELAERHGDSRTRSRLSGRQRRFPRSPHRRQRRRRAVRS